MNNTKKSYWSSIFGNPVTTLQQILNKENPENDFDISKWEKKFNWGAFFGGAWWFMFNCNFWFTILFHIVISICFWILYLVMMGILAWSSFNPSTMANIMNIAVLVLSIYIPIRFWIWLGQIGNRWTYKTRPYNDLEHFEKVQKQWASTMGLLWLLFIIGSVAIVIWINNGGSFLM